MIALRALFGGGPALAAGLGLLLAAGLGLVVGPRLAHRWFRGGRFTRAQLAYRALGWLRIDREARAALEVSAAACLLGRQRHPDGLRRLERIDEASLGETTRAVWLNNRAYALARTGGDLHRALADIDRAMALRPDLSDFRHTRGLVLLGLGRLDEALRELDAVWQRRASEDPSPLLEAERCYDLGAAWLRKGDPAYAADYFDRARRAAPDSPWAARALAAMPAGPASSASLGDLAG